MIISRTPYRISLFGGGTDCPAWYFGNGGSVLSTTIDKYCHITLRYLPPFFEHRIRLVYSKIEMWRSYEEMRHPAVRGSGYKGSEVAEVLSLSRTTISACVEKGKIFLDNKERLRYKLIN
jgi:galactokinase/mevalonate kinase-like predicted kinase